MDTKELLARMADESTEQRRSSDLYRVQSALCDVAREAQQPGQVRPDDVLYALNCLHPPIEWEGQNDFQESIRAAVPHVAILLGHADPVLARAAAYWYRRRTELSRHALSHLLNASKQGPFNFRFTVLQAILNSENPDYTAVAATMRSLLQDHNPDIRTMSVRILAKCGPDRLEDAAVGLSLALQDPIADVRLAAVLAASELKGDVGRRFAKELSRMTLDRSQHVRKAVTQALKALRESAM